MAYQFATYEKKDRIGIVTINRPERMNALHPPANIELHEIWNEFERDPDVWVGIVTGAGDKAFSAFSFKSSYGAEYEKPLMWSTHAPSTRGASWKRSGAEAISERRGSPGRFRGTRESRA